MAAEDERVHAGGLDGLGADDFVDLDDVRQDRLQTSLYDHADAGKLASIDAAVDRVRAAYGDRSIVRGAFLHSGIAPMQGGVNDGNYLLMGGHSL